MGGRGYSAAKADEVRHMRYAICSVMCRYVQPWYPYMTPIGVGGLCGGHDPKGFLTGAAFNSSWNSSAAPLV